MYNNSKHSISIEQPFMSTTWRRVVYTTIILALFVCCAAIASLAISGITISRTGRGGFGVLLCNAGSNIGLSLPWCDDAGFAYSEPLLIGDDYVSTSYVKRLLGGTGILISSDDHTKVNVDGLLQSASPEIIVGHGTEPGDPITLQFVPTSKRNVHDVYRQAPTGAIVKTIATGRLTSQVTYPIFAMGALSAFATIPIYAIPLGTGTVFQLIINGASSSDDSSWTTATPPHTGDAYFTLCYLAGNVQKSYDNTLCYPGGPHYHLTGAQLTSTPFMSVNVPLNISVDETHRVVWNVTQTIRSASPFLAFNIITKFLVT
jgi:hypothetical protein